ncbi:MAG TPA: hypothetical protein VMW91_02945 [Desulfosporosinus sp.]|nr:hypothetical protein [Desulfosporosinus sp.]
MHVYSVVIEDLHPHPIHGGGAICRLFDSPAKAAKCACEWIKEYIETIDPDIVGIEFEQSDLNAVLEFIKQEQYEKALDFFESIAWDSCPRVNKQKVE